MIVQKGKKETHKHKWKRGFEVTIIGNKPKYITFFVCYSCKTRLANDLVNDKPE